MSWFFISLILLILSVILISLELALSSFIVGNFRGRLFPTIKETFLGFVIALIIHHDGLEEDLVIIIAISIIIIFKVLFILGEWVLESLGFNSSFVLLLLCWFLFYC